MGDGFGIPREGLTGACSASAPESRLYMATRLVEPLPDVANGIAIERAVEHLRHIAGVRRSKHVGQFPQGMRVGERLDVIEIQSRPGDAVRRIEIVSDTSDNPLGRRSTPRSPNPSRQDIAGTRNRPAT
jgi:hypothetical protein